MKKWRFKPILRGEVKTDRSIILKYEDMGKQEWAPNLVWYLTDGENKVLVDTGFSNIEKVRERQPMFDVRSPGPLKSILEEEACSPEGIDALILSHLHWDHAGSIDAFPHLKPIVQRDEAQYAFAPLPIHATAYNSPSIGRSPEWAKTQLRFVDGTEELYGGLKMVKTPGHTPGHQSVVVETEEKTYGLAMDLIPAFENISRENFHPPDCMNVFEWWDSTRKFSRACDEVLPSHDPDLDLKWYG